MCQRLPTDLLIVGKVWKTSDTFWSLSLRTFVVIVEIEKHLLEQTINIKSETLHIVLNLELGSKRANVIFYKFRLFKLSSSFTIKNFINIL